MCIGLMTDVPNECIFRRFENAMKRNRNLYGTETLRRAVVVPIRFADLNAS